MSAVDAAVALLVPPGTPVVTVDRTRPPSGTALPVLSAGERLVLLDGRRLAVRRLRRLARSAGLVVDRELVVLPSLGEAAFVVEDAPESLGWFWKAFATVPPGRARGSLLVTAATIAGRHRLVLARAGRLVAGRMMIAHRP